MTKNLNVFESSILLRKIPYETLYKNNFKFLNLEKNNEVNLFFNLMPIIRFLQSDYNREEIEVMKGYKRYILSAELINLCAHYRNYYWTRHKVHTTFYMYYTFDMPSLKNKINPDYMKNYMDQFSIENPVYGTVNKLIRKNLELCEAIGDYLPHIYFFNTYDCDTLNIPGLFIPELRESNPRCANLLFGIFNQELEVLKFSYTKYVGYYGKFIGRKNVIKNLLKNTKYESDISYKFLPLIYSLIGDDKLGLYKFKNRFGFVGGIKKIEKLLQDNVISEDSDYDIEVISDILSNGDKKIKQNIIDNYKLISLDYAKNYLTKDTDNKIRERFTDLEDNSSIMEINNKYFPRNNIQLIELFQGEYRLLNLKDKTKKYKNEDI